MANEKILIVEDEATMRMLLTATLEGAGYQVMEAEDGDTGYQMAKTVKPDLIISDIVMPQMGGKELFNQLKINDTDLKVLFMSGYTDKTIVQHGMLETGVAFLQKPFLPDKLAHKVREVLDKL